MEVGELKPHPLPIHNSTQIGIETIVQKEAPCVTWSWRLAESWGYNRNIEKKNSVALQVLQKSQGKSNAFLREFEVSSELSSQQQQEMNNSAHLLTKLTHRQSFMDTNNRQTKRHVHFLHNNYLPHLYWWFIYNGIQSIKNYKPQKRNKKLPIVKG